MSNNEQYQGWGPSGVPVVNPAYPDRIMEKIFVPPERFTAFDLVIDGIMDAVSGKLEPGVTAEQLVHYPGYEKMINKDGQIQI